MTLHQRVEFERLLADYAEAYRLHYGATQAPQFRAIAPLADRLHNARCDLIAWVEHNGGSQG